jgi:hypothetical protein
VYVIFHFHPIVLHLITTVIYGEEWDIIIKYSATWCFCPYLSTAIVLCIHVLWSASNINSPTL